MDLRSASEGASWHPLSMLISFETRAAERELMFLPLREYPPGDRWSTRFEQVSTELHEVSHVWCARTSRLGFFLTRTATEQFDLWQNDRSVHLQLPERVHRLLGAYIPMLEGLALYAQLDFEAEEAGFPIPTPLTLVMQHSAVALDVTHLTLTDCFRTVGDGVRDEPIHGNDNLLQKLFLGSEDTQNHYFFGYLYIKAIQVLWSQRCPELSRPDLFLPLAVRVLCDHAIIEHALSETLTEKEIVTQVHDTVLSVRRYLPDFLRLLNGPELRASFDHWDLTAQIECGNWERPVFYTSAIESRFLADLPGAAPDRVSRRATQIGNSMSLYLLSWRSGGLRGVLEDHGNSLTSVQLCCAGEEIGIELPFLSGSYAESTDEKGKLAERVASAQVASLMSAGEQIFITKLREYVGQPVTLARFITLTRGTGGVALWAGEELRAWYVMSHGPMVDPDERNMIVRGLGIPPEDRQAFGRAFTDRSEIERCIVAGRSLLLDQLVSDQRAQAILGQRLNFLVPAHVPALRQWCAFHLWIKQYPPLPEALLREVHAVFDLPGFPDIDRKEFSLRNLLPSLSPGVTARPPQGHRSSGI